MRRRETGWSKKANLLYEILKKFNTQIGVMSNVVINGGGPTPPFFTVSNVSVKYNSIDATYLTNKAGLQGGTNFAANSNVLGVCTIVADNTANASLTYDQESDQLIVLNLNAIGNIGSRFFAKADVKTAMAAALGTIPTPVKTIVGHINALHGQAFDPITQTLYL
jgi:hypothetical protein